MTEDISWRLDGRLITIVAAGEYSIDAVFERLRQALGDPAAPEMALVLLDARAGTSRRTTAEIRDAANQALRLAARIDRVAIVVSTDVRFGLARMAGGFVEGSPLQLSPFHTLAEAYDFLGVPPPPSREP